jgi:hypothetical protein
MRRESRVGEIAHAKLPLSDASIASSPALFRPIARAQRGRRWPGTFANPPISPIQEGIGHAHME